ncbi:MAG: DUF456 domain-containing protein [Candidatus Sericytochromatia bacterium]|nr:DUF456 domain-containing protein [Candidatus Sericytochromatia bacterium]
MEFLLGANLARQFGGSNRAAWGSILGGVAGAVLGIPLPIIGSVTGAFLGAFLGAWIGERSLGASHHQATRVATGALLGRLVAMAAKTAIGTVMAVWILAAAVWGAPAAPSPTQTVSADVR